jgi:hypothetical protein
VDPHDIKFGRHPYRTNPNPVTERFFLGRLYDRLYYLHLRGLLAWRILTGRLDNSWDMNFWGIYGAHLTIETNR